MLEGGEIPIQFTHAEVLPKPTPQRFCHMIPGISAVKEQWRNVQKVVAESEIEGNKYTGVEVHDSSVSKNPHDPEHFQHIANSLIRDIKAAKETGGIVDVFTTSLGTSDIMRVVELVKKQNPQDIKMLRLFLISPWGLVKGGELNDPVGVLKGWSEGTSSVMRFGKLCVQLGLKGGDDMGFLSYQAILPYGVDPKKLSSAISHAYADRVQTIEGYPEVETLDTQMLKDQSKEYLKKMKPEDRDQLRKIDRSIQALIEEPSRDESWVSNFRIANKKRGIIIKPYIWKFFDDVPKDEANPTMGVKSESTFGQLAVSLCKHPLSAAQNVASIVNSTFGGDYKKLVELMNDEVSINLIGAELDLIDKGKQYERFMDEYKGKGTKPRAATMLTNEHISSYSLNQEALIRAINTVLRQPISQPS